MPDLNHHAAAINAAALDLNSAIKRARNDGFEVSIALSSNSASIYRIQYSLTASICGAEAPPPKG